MGFAPGPFELILIALMVLVPLGIAVGIYFVVKAAVTSANRKTREDE